MTAIPQPRKSPRQLRSQHTVETILQATARVLATHGYAGTNTNLIAETAGVSVGSLYQYFPNKAAILFRLQSDEWLHTTQMLQRILENPEQPPLARLRTLVQAFIRSECEEAQMRGALNDAAPLYRDAPEAHEVRAAGRQIFAAFMCELLPEAGEPTRTAACDLILTTLSSVGKDFSGNPRSDPQITAFANGLADMFSAYVVVLNQPSG